jgi:hypothetical protein
MARHSTGLRATGVGSTTLPFAAVCGVANFGGSVVEVGCFNTTAVAVAVKLVRLTTAGTPGAGTVEAEHNPDGPTPNLVGFDVYTSTGPTLIDLGYRAPLGAAIGAGVIWTFGDKGLWIPPGPTNGIGIILAVGTGQICDWYMAWDE